MAYELSYGERLKVGWLWLWRGLLVGGLMGFLLGIVLGIISAIMGLPEDFSIAVSGLLGVVVGIFVALPIVVKMMLKKQFSTFRLEVASTSE